MGLCCSRRGRFTAIYNWRRLYLVAKKHRFWQRVFHCVGVRLQRGITRRFLDRLSRRSVDNPGSFEGGICARVWMDASLPMKKENLTNILFRQASCSVPATHAAFLLPWESGPLQRILGNAPGLIPQPVFVPQPDASMTVSPEAPRPVQAPLKVPVRKQWNTGLPQTPGPRRRIGKGASRWRCGCRLFSGTLFQLRLGCRHMA